MIVPYFFDTSRKCYSISSIANMSMFFSYETLIAVCINGKTIRVTNTWGPTTGRHFNLMGLKDAQKVNQNKMYEEIQKQLTKYGIELMNKRIKG